MTWTCNKQYGQQVALSPNACIINYCKMMLVCVRGNRFMMVLILSGGWIYLSAMSDSPVSWYSHTVSLCSCMHSATVFIPREAQFLAAPSKLCSHFKFKSGFTSITAASFMLSIHAPREKIHSLARQGFLLQDLRLFRKIRQNNTMYFDPLDWMY